MNHRRLKSCELLVKLIKILIKMIKVIFCFNIGEPPSKSYLNFDD